MQLAFVWCGGVTSIHAIDDARPGKIALCAGVRLMQSACARVKASGGGGGEAGKRGWPAN